MTDAQISILNPSVYLACVDAAFTSDQVRCLLYGWHCNPKLSFCSTKSLPAAVGTRGDAGASSAARSRAASERRFRMASMKSDSSRLMQANEDRDVDSDVVVAFVVDRVRGDATSRNTASLLGHLRLQEHAGLTCVNVCFGTFSSTCANEMEVDDLPLVS
mmetsp:Transcript_4070/g.16387  ORF Transcript_4070/g.16387 Transcript_4070/m.16387 type:complete len:160 (+) Transcript_4070:304-783(+)